MQTHRGFVDRVKVGDSVYPAALWNRSVRRKEDQLPDKCEILAINRGPGSQSRVKFRVRNCGGVEVELDSGWFTGMVERESEEESE